MAKTCTPTNPCPSPRADWSGFSFIQPSSAAFEWVTTSPLADVDHAIAEVLAVGGFTMTGGGPGGTFFQITVNGVDIAPAPVWTPQGWEGSIDDTAIVMAFVIDLAPSVPEYAGSCNVPPIIDIIAAPGSGSTPNGFAINVVTTGSFTVGDIRPMAGGVDAVPGGVYNTQLVTANNAGPVTYSVIGGAFPGGLSMNASGLVSGTCTEVAPGIFTATVRADDGVTQIDRPFTIRVVAP